MFLITIQTVVSYLKKSGQFVRIRIAKGAFELTKRRSIANFTEQLKSQVCVIIVYVRSNVTLPLGPSINLIHRRVAR